MKIIPAIDLMNGKAVRLTRGDYSKMKLYHNNPVELAMMFEDAGLKRLHLVDLDGARHGSVQHLKLLEKICNRCKLQVDFGGGVKSFTTVKEILHAGACLVTIGSIAVTQPALLQEWAAVVGVDKFYIGADVFKKKILINGWQQETEIKVDTFLKEMMGMGFTNFFCTDIEKDGLLQGSSIQLYKQLLKQFSNCKLTASGGVNSIEDLLQLKKIGCYAAIIGKAYYEGNISLQQMASF